jgi:tellurite resistance protein
MNMKKPVTVSPHAALIYVMVVVAAADGVMSENELRAIGSLVKTLPVFRSFDEDRLIVTSQECAAILQEDDGLNVLLGLVKTALPPHLRETAYWLALEIALADPGVKLEEVRVIELLRRALGLEHLMVAALERGARARYQTA